LQHLLTLIYLPNWSLER